MQPIPPMIAPNPDQEVWRRIPPMPRPGPSNLGTNNVTTNQTGNQTTQAPTPAPFNPYHLGNPIPPMVKPNTDDHPLNQKILIQAPMIAPDPKRETWQRIQNIPPMIDPVNDVDLYKIPPMVYRKEDYVWQRKYAPPPTPVKTTTEIPKQLRDILLALVMQIILSLSSNKANS